MKSDENWDREGVFRVFKNLPNPNGFIAPLEKINESLGFALRTAKIAVTRED